MSLALAPAVFTLHFLALYVLVSLACPAGLAALVRPGVIAATLAALAFYALFARASRRRYPAADETPAFVARVNVLVSALSAVASLWLALPAFLVAPCAS